jgi:hypothetical protein
MKKQISKNSIIFVVPISHRALANPEAFSSLQVQM